MATRKKKKAPRKKKATRKKAKRKTAKKKSTRKKSAKKAAKKGAKAKKKGAKKRSAQKGHPLEGKRAPAFELQGDDGKAHSLKDFKGKHLVIYFYPKAMTPGCTIESREFTSDLKAFERAGAKVVGVSPDSVDRLCRFRDKESLTHLLLSDDDHAVAAKYGAWGKKSLYGRVFQGIIRSTVVVGPTGKVVRGWPKVRVKGHVAEVLQSLK